MCVKSVSKMFQGSFLKILNVFRKMSCQLQRTSNVFKGNLNGVSGKIQGVFQKCFKGNSNRNTGAFPTSFKEGLRKS